MTLSRTQSSKRHILSDQNSTDSLFLLTVSPRILPSPASSNLLLTFSLTLSGSIYIPSLARLSQCSKVTTVMCTTWPINSLRSVLPLASESTSARTTAWLFHKHHQLAYVLDSREMLPFHRKNYSVLNVSTRLPRKSLPNLPLNLTV